MDENVRISILYNLLIPSFFPQKDITYHKDLEKHGDCDSWLSESLVRQFTTFFLLF